MSFLSVLFFASALYLAQARPDSGLPGHLDPPTVPQLPSTLGAVPNPGDMVPPIQGLNSDQEKTVTEFVKTFSSSINPVMDSIMPGEGQDKKNMMKNAMIDGFYTYVKEMVAQSQNKASGAVAGAESSVPSLPPVQSLAPMLDSVMSVAEVESEA